MSSVSKTRHLYCGELARLSGVSADTVRFYERRRLLPPAARTSAGYRIFPADSLARMHTIRAGLSWGSRSVNWRTFSASEVPGMLLAAEFGSWQLKSWLF